LTYSSDNILIVGGGSAGWMTAAHLIKMFPEKNITVLESDIVPTVGVGESTLSDFKIWLDFLSIDIKDFMLGCDATFKLGISFIDFLQINSDPIHYMFGGPDLRSTKFGLKDWSILKLNNKDLPFTDYIDYYWKHSYAVKTNKLPYEKNDNIYPFNFKNDVGFQVNAIKFAEWLKEKYCMPRGVNRIIDTVENVVKNENGIESLNLKSGKKISADLYIDCTGFKSILLGKEMKSEFISTEKTLPNNKAWFGPYQYTDKEKELELSTRCTALKNGWVWNTPLWSRVGSGYAYCDKYIDDESALEEFKNYLDSDKMPLYDPNRSKKMEFRKIEIKNGYYKTPWIKNVVAVGLSQGFLEPLESTGLFILHKSVSDIADSLSRDKYTKWDSDRFNRKINIIYEAMFKFVEAHYAMSLRNDSKYWIDIVESCRMDTINFVSQGAHGSASQIYVGFGHIENGFNELYQLYSNKNIENVFDVSLNENIRREQIKLCNKFIDSCPSHYQYLKECIYE